MLSICVIVASLLISVNAQRGSFAGSAGNGYKDTYLEQPTTNTGNSFIENRNSENDNSIVNQTPNLPIDARGDANLVNYWNSLPFEQRPFWLVNQQHVEAHRNTPTRRPVDSSMTQSNFNPLNPPNFADRINVRVPDGAFSQFPFNTNTQLPNNQQSGGSQDVVYPSNITPEQRIEMEIRFLRQRQEALEQIRRQLQQSNQPNNNNNLVQNSRSQQGF